MKILQVEVEPDGSELLKKLAMDMVISQSREYGFEKTLFDMIPRHILEPMPNRAYRIGEYYLEFKGVDPSDPEFVSFHVTVRKPKQLRLL